MAARIKKVGSAVVLGVIVVVGVYMVAAAGALEPPGPPAPTMKTLNDVEPRTPIHAADLPYVILEPGSYYLAEDIQTSGSGIYIMSDHVTLDLMGHRLAGGTGNGIEALAPVNGVVIRNGTVSVWGASGIHVTGSIFRIESIHAIGNSLWGINAGEYATVSDCTSADNGDGIKIGHVGSVVESISRGNVGSGIDAGNYARITSCTSTTNGGTGILVGHGSIVRESISSINDGYGIDVHNFTHLLNNHCYANGFNQHNMAIRVTGAGSRIEGNHLPGNGLSATGTNNIITRNSIGGPTAAWDVDPLNDLGPIGDASTGTSPWQNMEY